MKTGCVLLSLTIVFMATQTILLQSQEFSILKGPYLGQSPPGNTPEVFAPGFISTEKRELNSVFTPDGKEFYFSIQTPGKGYSIWYTREEDNGWIKPRIAPFSSKYSDVDMCISYDGKRMFYGSTRPLKKGGRRPKDFQIWMVEQYENEWGEPKNLGAPVNSGDRALYPTITEDGTLYFQGIFPESFGGRDIYRSRLVNGKYSQPENLGAAINTRYDEGDVLIAPDESFLIVCVGGRSDGYGGGDLYISFRKSDGSWSKTKNMGKTINSEATEYCPMLSPDGKYLFFTSKKTGNGDVYWVDAKIIEELIPEELK